MSRTGQDEAAPAAIEGWLEEIIAGAGGDDERLRGFRQAFEREVAVPCDGFVLGEPVSVIGFDYDGNVHRGLTARCRRTDGSEHVVAVCDVVLPRRSRGARYVAAYRKWLGLEPFPWEAAVAARRGRQHKATSADIDAGGTVELVVLSVKDNGARCRLRGTERIITLRARSWDLVPGHVAVVRPRKQWSYAGHPYLSGEIESTRLDVGALDLVPLRLEEQGIWDPRDHYWGEPDEPIGKWARPIIARGPRPMFEMEQVLPGETPDDPFDDPITEANDLRNAGESQKAYRILMKLCETDLRCLDAHAHLGNFFFESLPEDAIRHYEVGLRIGELSLGPGFDGLLPWGHIDNRPFLRCMHGYGLCLWRLGRFEEAGRVFDRMLWLNPSDNQGVRFLIGDVRARRSWDEHRD